MINANEVSPSADKSDPRKKLLAGLGVVVAVAALVYGAWYYFTQRGFIHTDNAYVGADTAQITPLVSGAIRELRISNTRYVKKGDVLLVLDDADAQVEVAAAQATLLQAQQRFGQTVATGSALSARVDARSSDTTQAGAKLAVAKSNVARARTALGRRESLAQTGAVSGEELSLAQSDMATAMANLELAHAGVSAAEAMQKSAAGDLTVNRIVTRGMTIDNNPDVATARARLDAAELNLARTVLRAPISGIVTQNQVQIGQRVAAGASVMVIVPVDTAFVDANFKENQLGDIRIGQPVKLTSDYYGDGIVFRGRVIGLAGGTGAAFSLIPAQNATGNWVKVIQRLPVRITIAPEYLREHPLRVGLSMDVVVDTRRY